MTQTPQDKAIAKIRKRNLEAAKRSLKLLADGAAQAAAILDEGGVPEQAFTASVINYEKARSALALLDMIAAGNTREPDGLVEVSRDDLAPLVGLIRSGAPEAPADSHLGRLEQALAEGGEAS